MNVRTRAIAGVILMSLLLVMYFVFVGVRAVALLGSGSLLAITMGVALLFLPLLGIWALLRELQFGRRATALVDQLRDEGQLPDFAAEQTQQTQQTEQTGSLPGTRDSGDIDEDEVRERTAHLHDRSLAERAFPKFRAEVEAHPESWRAWTRLGIAYDVAGDRRRARSAIRTAIAQNRSEASNMQ